jgi:hypothetical protein
MLAAVKQCCLNLVPMVAWDYSRYSQLLVHQSAGVVVPSQSGVRQGDPLGPLVFTVTLQGPLEVIEEMQLARPLAFADNTFVQGSQEPTMQAFAALAAPLSLHARPAKSAVYSEDVPGNPSRQTLHRSGLPYGQSGPKISRKSSVPRALYVEPWLPTWSTDLADVAPVGGSWGQLGFLTCHSAGPL